MGNVIGNWRGMAMFVASALVVLVGWAVLELPNPIIMSATGLSVSLMDGLSRWRERGQKGWWYASRWGGVLFYLPAWAFGLVVIAINLSSPFIDPSGE